RECGRTKNGTRGVGRILLRTHLPPHRRRLGIRIRGGQQQLRLMGTQGACRFRTSGPPLEPALRQSLRREPEALSVIRQQLYGGTASAAEDDKTAGKRI